MMWAPQGSLQPAVSFTEFTKGWVSLWRNQQLLLELVYIRRLGLFKAPNPMGDLVSGRKIVLRERRNDSYCSCCHCLRFPFPLHCKLSMNRKSFLLSSSIYGI